jgi:hypothetical protein
MKAYIILVIILLSELSHAATNYYTRQAGTFITNTTWSTTSHSGGAAASAPCACACSVAGNNYLEIDHAISISCDLTFTGNPNVVIRSGGSLSVEGNANVTGSVTFTIESGASMYVSGDFNVTGGGGSVTVDGTLTIGGDMTINGAYPVCGTGTVTYSGNLTGGGNMCGLLTVLPVEWLYIEARHVQNAVVVKWATASERNAEYFTVQKSTDANEFATVTTVTASGNSTSVREYAATDYAPAKGINYYRVKETDYDGQADYSGIVVLYIADNGMSVTIAPTHVTQGQVGIYFSGIDRKKARITLTDMSGKIIRDGESLIVKGKEMVYEISPNTATGIYLLSVSTDDFGITEKIVVDK